jgi:hypothetical protein
MEKSHPTAVREHNIRFDIIPLAPFFSLEHLSVSGS